MTARHAAETIAQATVPVPLSISSLTWLGVTVQDWVLLGTAILLVFQLIVIAPKVVRSIRYLFKGGSDDRNQGAT